MSKRYTANRSIYKQHKPADVPPPPAGYGYVGRGIPDSPFIDDASAIAIRFVPVGTEDHDYLTVPGRWSTKTLEGLRDYAHYAIPMDIWNKIDFPPELH